jgi:hypothetical protein
LRFLAFVLRQDRVLFLTSCQFLYLLMNDEALSELRIILLLAAGFNLNV